MVCAKGFHADFQRDAFGAADVANLHTLSQRVLVPCLIVLVPVVCWGSGCERFAPPSLEFAFCPFGFEGDDAHVAKHVFSCSVAHHLYFFACVCLRDHPVKDSVSSCLLCVSFFL